MEIPNLVRERLGGESIEATVNLGDEDVICVTPTRTFLYRGEGLLSDESVDVYSHDVERVDLSEGRRNTKFVLEYVDGKREFKVPSGRGDTLLKILLQGMLRVADVTDDDESVAGVFQFSELTLVVTDARLVKHIGASVWDSDFEVYDYEDVTELNFEEGSVATQIVLTVNGRPQRIKAPNDKAGKVEQTLTQMLCAYYDVNSLEELTARLDDGADEVDDDDGTDVGTSSDIALDDGISPLVGGDEETDHEDDASTGDDLTRSTEQVTSSPSPSGRSDVDTGTTGSDRGSDDGATVSGTTSQSAERDSTDERGGDTRAPSQPTADDGQAGSGTDTESAVSVPVDVATGEDIEAVKEQLSTLTEAVKRQNKLLRQHNERIDDHDEKIDQLIEELRQGR